MIRKPRGEAEDVSEDETGECEEVGEDDGKDTEGEGQEAKADDEAHSTGTKQPRQRKAPATKNKQEGTDKPKRSKSVSHNGDALTLTIQTTPLRIKPSLSLESIKEKLAKKEAKLKVVLTIQAVSEDGTEEILCEGNTEKLIEWEWSDSLPQKDQGIESSDNADGKPSESIGASAEQPAAEAESQASNTICGQPVGNATEKPSKKLDNKDDDIDRYFR